MAKCASISHKRRARSHRGRQWCFTMATGCWVERGLIARSCRKDSTPVPSVWYHHQSHLGPQMGASMPRIHVITMAILFVCSAQLAAQDSIDYSKQIKPLLKERCYTCHGALKQKADLR